MIKVKHSKSQRIVLLDFSGEVDPADIKNASAAVSSALRDIGKGYTLIEIFHDHPHFDELSCASAGTLAACCYDCSRIWRVIRVEDSQHADPGFAILHRTRWDREVPEMEVDNVREALAIAREEIREQEEWLDLSSEPQECSPSSSFSVSL